MRMRSAVIAILVLVTYCEARPSINFNLHPSFDSYIVGGKDALPGEFPWQLSQQRQGGSTWSHSCGASLLSHKYALSAAHCVDGAPTSIIRVIAGLHDRTAIQDGVVSNIASYKLHETYGKRPDATFSDDIAILTLATAIYSSKNTIQYATLPADNEDNFVGETGVISGWGRTSASNALPVNLQKATIGIISTARANELMSDVSGAIVADSHIALFDEQNKIGSCNGDSGGPLNVVDSRRKTVVAGVTSWGISSWFACSQQHPSVYTRTGFYLEWINQNTQ